MPDYQKSKIYKIYCPSNPDEIYIGSTTNNRLSERMSKHRNTFNYKDKYTHHYQTTAFILFEKYGIENCIIELIENCPCNNKDELKKREGFFIRQFNCVNRNITDRTREEYRQENKEKINQQVKEWCKKNKEKSRDIKKNWVLRNPEKVKEIYTKTNQKKNKEKWICEVCNKKMLNTSKYYHLKTTEHLSKLSQ